MHLIYYTVPEPYINNNNFERNAITFVLYLKRDRIIKKKKMNSFVHERGIKIITLR